MWKDSPASPPRPGLGLEAVNNTKRRLSKWIELGVSVGRPEREAAWGDGRRRKRVVCTYQDRNKQVRTSAMPHQNNTARNLWSTVIICIFHDWEAYSEPITTRLSVKREAFAPVHCDFTSAVAPHLTRSVEKLKSSTVRDCRAGTEGIDNNRIRHYGRLEERNPVIVLTWN